MNISPIDGRYREKTKDLSQYFSEYALMKTRVEIEIEYLIHLSNANIKGLSPFSYTDIKKLQSIIENFNEKDAIRIKEIESQINHDVKAIEYFIKEKSLANGLDFNSEFIHFGLTSQDINNTAFPLMLKRYITEKYIPTVTSIIDILTEKANEWKDIAILAKTHGQPASPTTLGKEMFVFVNRLEKQLDTLINTEHSAKFGGATGNLNAHKTAYPHLDWREFADNFVASLGLVRQKYTTQIEHYDNMVEKFDASRRIQTILVDFARDVWSYISFDIFSQKILKNEVGSSAMPHKVNPIDFENAEGNLMYANSILDFLSNKLPISRLQRDLTDSTVLRNVGVPYAHFQIASSSLLKGISKLTVNQKAITEELANNWIVIAEGIQTILRREGIEKPYELLKDYSRQNDKPTKEAFQKFIQELPVEEAVKEELKLLSPETYIGYKYLD